ncbi:MAG: ferredoxin [candidate division WOR-3 bacterium]|nr:ferredoxin [candidate division WOR-3 bacterium]MDH5683789.1 ferredoxin [candidate division WOR-3 bacterium]
MKIKIDKRRCTGCGLCVNICPNLFKIGYDGLALAKKSKLTKPDCLKIAAEHCPSGAIIYKA